MGSKIPLRSNEIKQHANAAFCVATNGNDAWSGKLAEPNADKTDGPFATLHRARDAVRELKKEHDGLKEPVTVMVRGGKYYTERALDLGAVDSGTDKAPICYTAYPGEKPVISGGRRITGWQPYKDKIFKCEFPEAKGGVITFRQLFANGEPQIRARYPNLDPDATSWNGRWARSKVDEAALESSEPYIVWDEPDAFQRSWTKPTQGELFIMPRQTMWGDSALIRIKSIDREKKIIKLVHGMRSFDLNPIHFSKKGHHPENCQFIVENMLEELDQPGEWCLDTEEGMLYFWPPKDSIDNMEIVIPALKCLVHMEGVSNVRISGFIFTEAKGGEPSSHYDDVEGVGAMAPQMGWEYCGETIYMNRCKNCYIENNRIFNVGGNGIYLRHHNERNLIRGNEIGYAGANGIVLAGGRHSIYQSTGGTQGTPHPIFNEITDNTIHHIGLIDTYAAGIFLGLSNWNRIVHNDIHDVPHHAVNLGNSRYGRNYIEYNRITRAGKVTHDNAAINCWHEMPPEMEPPGHVIRYNFITDTGNVDTGGVGYSITMGIYLDNWSSNCIVYGNIIVNTMPNGYGVGILVKGRNNIIENNILINSGKNHICVMDHCCYDEFATIVYRNIFYDTLNSSGSVFNLADRDHLRKVLLQCDNNLFFKKGEDNPLIIREDGRVLGLRPFPNGYHAEEQRFDTVLINEKMEGARTNADFSSRNLGPVPAAAIKGDFPTDEEWAGGMSLPRLVTSNGMPAEPEEVEARLLRDSKYLYLRARCCCNKQYNKSDSSTVMWQTEHIEFFVKPLLINKKPFLQFAVSSDGQVHQAFCNTTDDSAKSILWNAKAQKLNDEKWEAVIRVPIEEVKFACGGSTPAWGIFLGACSGPRYLPFADWRKERQDASSEDVYDANSIVADPLFVDAANGDYRLKPESPAFELGFQSIAISKIAVQKKTARYNICSNSVTG